ncbi:DNA-binding protein [Polychytrium aggregatum]|uniref:DNA-binding protein n=1 Tax=Polychytrium aggregatum TaxID=110093 RepID=UPI0022FDD5D7|nr:DNA-binding protein [Polychytrium aggregatum]KAI9193719.1 DNA-binding protein [Polychytrium aggregatum]
MAGAQMLNYVEIVDVLCEFFEVAVHFILYHRGVYPADLFETCRKYGIAVKRSRHPDLNSYISEAVAAMKPDMEKGLVKKIHIVILSDKYAALERFTFEIKSLANRSPDPGHQRQGSVSISQLQDHLRAFLMKLATCEGYLSNLPQGITFRIHVEMEEDFVPASMGSEGSAWVPGDEDEIRVSNPSIVPLRTVDMGAIRVQMFVEEAGLHVTSSDDLIA